jgi:UDP-glucose 4-epimerase
MRYLITGGAGFIGRNLIEYITLRDSEAYFTVIDSLKSGINIFADNAVTFFELDIADIKLDEWPKFLDGVDYVFHLAAEKYNSPGANFDSILTTNVYASNLLFEACAKSKVKKVFFASSLYAYGNMGPDAMEESNACTPFTYYGMSKLAGENLLQIMEAKFKLPWVAARLFFIYGPGQYVNGGYKSVIVKNFENLKRGEPVSIYGSGTQSLDYVYVEDCCEAIFNLTVQSNSSSSIYNISGGTAISINSLVGKIKKVSHTNYAPEIRMPSDWTEGSIRLGKNEKIKSAIGWEPFTSLELGLEKTWNWVSSYE